MKTDHKVVFMTGEVGSGDNKSDFSSSVFLALCFELLVAFCVELLAALFVELFVEFPVTSVALRPILSRRVSCGLSVIMTFPQEPNAILSSVTSLPKDGSSKRQCSSR
jgi:hypothetical protein